MLSQGKTSKVKYRSIQVNPDTHWHCVKGYENGFNQGVYVLVLTGRSEDFLGLMLNFFHSMAALRVTEAEYTLLTATTLLCSGQTSNRFEMSN